MYEDKAKEYLINKIKTASPMELVIIVYDTAISSLNCVYDDWEQKDPRMAFTHILKAQKCLRELKSSLNMEIEEMSHSLFSLYRVLDKMLIRVQREKDKVLLDKIIKMLTELRDTWIEVAKKEPSRPQHMAHTAGASYINTYK